LNKFSQNMCLMCHRNNWRSWRPHSRSHIIRTSTAERSWPERRSLTKRAYRLVL